MKKLYFKVYQDRNSTEGYEYYIDTIENSINIMPDLLRTAEECGSLPPVFEPIEMEEEEFRSLPEFAGF